LEEVDATALRKARLRFGVNPRVRLQTLRKYHVRRI
jgi:hypothetical protein